MTEPIDRLVRKEVQLGVIRELQPPQDHIGLAQIAPFMDVDTDDVIFDYISGGLQDGLAPARAEDAEAELAQKDDLAYGSGRAAVIDWSLKDKYDTSDVTRYRVDQLIQERLQGVNTTLPIGFAGSHLAEFEQRVARDTARRSRYLYNRFEWLIMQAIQTGGISYNDGKIKFTVDFGRPSGQMDQPAASVASAGSPLYVAANSAIMDPIGDFKAVKAYMYEQYGISKWRVYGSTKAFDTIWLADKWLQRFVGTQIIVGGTPSATPDMNYLLPGNSWSQEAAVTALAAGVGDVSFHRYDAVYRTRPVGGTTFTNVRFLADDRFYWLPDPSDPAFQEIDDTRIGFAKTLTSPHPAGNFTSGFYEWETETIEPWQRTLGTGCKAFPVFPYMQYTYSMKVL